MRIDKIDVAAILCVPSIMLKEDSYTLTDITDLFNSCLENNEALAHISARSMRTAKDSYTVKLGHKLDSTIKGMSIYPVRHHLLKKFRTQYLFELYSIGEQNAKILYEDLPATGFRSCVCPKGHPVPHKSFGCPVCFGDTYIFSRLGV